MNIDRDKLSKAIMNIEVLQMARISAGQDDLENPVVNIDKKSNEALDIAKKVLSLFLAGKIGEVKSKEEIEKIIDDCFPEGTNYYNVIKTKLVSALVGKVGKEGGGKDEE